MCTACWSSRRREFTVQVDSGGFMESFEACCDSCLALVLHRIAFKGGVVRIDVRKTEEK